jgi:hypothetical protein
LNTNKPIEPVPFIGPEMAQALLVSGPLNGPDFIVSGPMNGPGSIGFWTNEWPRFFWFLDQ